MRNQIIGPCNSWGLWPSVPSSRFKLSSSSRVGMYLYWNSSRRITLSTAQHTRMHKQMIVRWSWGVYSSQNYSQGGGHESVLLQLGTCHKVYFPPQDRLSFLFVAALGVFREFEHCCTCVCACPCKELLMVDIPGPRLGNRGDLAFWFSNVALLHRQHRDDVGLKTSSRYSTTSSGRFQNILTPIFFAKSLLFIALHVSKFSGHPCSLRVLALISMHDSHVALHGTLLSGTATN